MQPKLPHFRPEVARKPILRINLRCQRGDAVGGKARGSFADHVRIFAKGEIKRLIHPPSSHDPLLAPRLSRSPLLAISAIAGVMNHEDCASGISPPPSSRAEAIHEQEVVENRRVEGALEQTVRDRKSVVWGKSVSVRVDLGGGRITKKKK